MKKLATAIIVQCATLGPIGYLPAGGTLASLCTLVFLYALHNYSSTLTLYAISGMLCASVGCIEHALKFFKQKDPSQIVLDEVMGMSVAFILSEKEPLLLILTFFLFRVFDIIKPGIIHHIESQEGVLGVVGDDLIAGFLAVGVSGIAIKFIHMTGLA